MEYRRLRKTGGGEDHGGWGVEGWEIGSGVVLGSSEGKTKS